MTDPHFNLFYSYDRGSQKDPDRISQLEDNVTRGFLIALQHLSDTDRKEFLRNLLTGTGIKKSQLSNLSFDLQNIDDRNNLSKIQKGRDVKKILLTISRDSFDVDEMKQKIVNIVNNRTIKEMLSADDDDEKNKKAKIKKKLASELIRLKNDDDECKPIQELGNKKFKRKELSSIISALGECRPDGWIYNDKIAILVESKIGNNTLSEYQVFRHIVGSYGFSMKQKYMDNLLDNKVSLVTKTWDEISKELNTLNKPIKEKETKIISKYLTTSYLEYLAMTGETFSFDHIINGKATKEDQKVQLEFLVDRISKKVPYQPKRKAQVRHVWQQLGEDDIHFSVYVWSDRIAIDLAIMDKVQTKIKKEWDLAIKNITDLDGLYLGKLLWENHFKKAVEDEDFTGHRYEFYLNDYRIFDRYSGLQNSGVNRIPAQVTINGEWIKREYSNETKFHKFLDESIRPLIGKYKQIGVKYTIPIPEKDEVKRRKDNAKWNRNDSPRYLNDYNDLMHPEKVVGAFVRFIDTWKEFVNQYTKNRPQ